MLSVFVKGAKKSCFLHLDFQFVLRINLLQRVFVFVLQDSFVFGFDLGSFAKKRRPSDKILKLMQKVGNPIRARQQREAFRKHIVGARASQADRGKCVFDLFLFVNFQIFFLRF